MKEISHWGTKFNIDPDDYYNADYIERYTDLMFSPAPWALVTAAANVVISKVWTPIIANYFGVSDVPGAQETIAGVFFVGLQSMSTGLSIEAAEKIYDSYKVISDYSIAAVGEAYDSYTGILSAD